MENKLTWDVTDQVYQNGWNHIKVPLSGGAGEGEPDLSTATWLQFFMEDYTGMHASRDYALALSNLYATKASDNPMTETLLISANGAGCLHRAGRSSQQRRLLGAEDFPAGGCGCLRL